MSDAEIAQRMPQETAAHEVQRLRALVRDLEACLTLNALWTGRNPAFIAESFLDAILSILRLDIAYIRLNKSNGEAPFEAIRPHGGVSQEEMGVAMQALTTAHDGASAPHSIPNPFAKGTLRIARSYLGVNQDGMVVAGSMRASFPTAIESFLLSAAVNQAALSLQAARTLEQSLERQRALARSEERFELAARATNDSIWDLNLLTNELWWNERSKPLFGYKPEEIEPGIEAWFNRIHPEDRGRVVAGFHAVLERKDQFWTDEYRFRRADGSYANVLDRAYIIYDDMGEPVRAVGAIADISSRTRAEQALRESETRFRLLVSEVSDYAIFMLDTAGRVTSWNMGAERIKGYQAGEIMGQHFSRFYPPNDIAAGKPDRALQAAAAEGRFENEGWRVRKDGSLFWASVIITAVHDEIGQIVGYSKVTRDLTERKQAEEALRRNEAKLRDFIETATIGLHWIGEDGTILWANKAELDMLGYSREEYIGRHIADFHIDTPLIEDILTRLRRGETLREYEARLRCKDGSIRHVLIDSSALFERSKFVHTRCFTRDITDRRRAEEALREADRRKDEFLAVLGHEFRNPLNVIATTVQLLGMKGPAVPTMQELRNTMTLEVSQLARLLDDLLDVSRIARGLIRPKKEPCDLVKIVRDVAEARHAILKTTGLEFTVQYPPQPVWVFGDRTRLAQIIGNLLDNANKFTGSGGQVRVRLCEEAETKAAVLSVADTGMGIDAEMLKRIFEPFTQADRTVNSSRGGLGLGLALVKGLVDLHGGEVWVRSDGPGRGAEFTIRLPLTSERQTLSKPTKSVDRMTERRRILLIEDNLAAAQSLRMFLTGKGHAVERAATGVAGIETARRFGPEIVLCDIGLPGLDGYAVARILRQQHETSGVFLIAVSGYGQDADQQRAAEAGFDGYLTKPIDFEELEQLLVTHR